MKGLKSLEIIENEYSIDESVFYKEDFKQVRKELKALEIIKKKTVDIWLIQKKTLKQYNLLVDESRQLTEEQFNLLKEVLEWFLKCDHW